jgi:hypothetical protein
MRIHRAHKGAASYLARLLEDGRANGAAAPPRRGLGR